MDQAVSLVVPLEESGNALRSWSEDPSRVQEDSGVSGSATMNTYTSESTTRLSSGRSAEADCFAPPTAGTC